MKKYFYGVVGWMAAAFVLAAPTDGGEGNVHESIQPAAFKQKMAEMEGTLLDVRTPKEFGEGHLIGATNLDYHHKEFKEKLLALPKDKTYFVYCRSGGRSGRTLDMMREAGFHRVYDMAGGFLKWSAAGYPSEK